ncbi:hypothetical protein N9L68_05335 [bacterium]|nr:hypothetical protein [bacterium]
MIPRPSARDSLAAEGRRGDHPRDVISGPSHSAGDSLAAGGAAAAGRAAAAPGPPTPQNQHDRAVSPFGVVGELYVQQVDSANMFLTWCRQAIDNFDEFMETSALDDKIQIRKTLQELAAKVKEGTRVQALGELSQQVASPLYLVFEVIIPVM